MTDDMEEQNTQGMFTVAQADGLTKVQQESQFTLLAQGRSVCGSVVCLHVISESAGFSAGTPACPSQSQDIRLAS